MREMPAGLIGRVGGARRRTLSLLVGVVALLALAAAASSASALSLIKQEFLPFAHCPVTEATQCVDSHVTGGEFKIDLKTVPIENVDIELQGGLESDTFKPLPLIAAVGAPTLSETPLVVPGGLAGIGGIGGEVTATAELAEPVSSILVEKGHLLNVEGTAVVLPIKVKLSNEILGNECYIGSDAEPIILNLTTGTTAPPFPGTPISGFHSSPEGAVKAKGKITKIKEVTLVDNTFAVPGATGCGGSLSPVVDLAVDADIGLPAPAGLNTAIMKGSFEETTSEFEIRYKAKPKKEKKVKGS
jgi:hypothetical protein